MKNRTLSVLFSASFAVLSPACVGGAKDAPPPDQTEALKAFTLDKEPADARPVGVNYDNKITLVASKVEPATPIKPGDRVKVTNYWRCDKELGEGGWKLFTHVTDASGERILNIDSVGPLRKYVEHDQVLGPSAWKAGKVYVDTQEFQIPKKVRTATINVTTGVWKADERLPIVSGPKERDNRGIAATIRVEGGAPDPQTTRVPELRVDKMEKGQKIVVDGKLDDEAWKTAPSTGPFVDVRTGQPNPSASVTGSAKVLWDDQNLYVGFDVKDKNVVGGFKKDEKDPHLWTKDTVEIMVDPDGDGDNKDYYEIQVNPQNLVFDSQFDSYNTPKKEPDGPFGHQEWSAKLKSAVVVTGTMDKEDDQDTGYAVEVAIPWKSFDKAKQTPPELGQTWRLNFYAMENNGGESWSPILGQGNFHRASRFGKILFAAKGWTPPAPSAAPPGSAAPAGSGAPAPSAAPPRPGTPEPKPTPKAAAAPAPSAH
ncbi:MAG TPA: carbohydrate-binding family 9-like protein [Polyangiaceae bacterium]|nr:carbohydrate-binding family 9-like protein [Polyangiaceae bacterium]